MQRPGGGGTGEDTAARQPKYPTKRSRGGQPWWQVSQAQLVVSLTALAAVCLWVGSFLHAQHHSVASGSGHEHELFLRGRGRSELESSIANVQPSLVQQLEKRWGAFLPHQGHVGPGGEGVITKVQGIKGSMDYDEAVEKRALELEAMTNNGTYDRAMRPGFHLSGMGQFPPYPYQIILNMHDRDSGAVNIIAPFFNFTYYQAEAARALFWRLKASGHIMLGIASYQEFPQQVVNPFDDRHTTPADWEIYSAMDGWLHCFRDPDNWVPTNVPRILFSESDYGKSDDLIMPDNRPEKKYDLVHSNLGGEWNDFCRNWTLAKASFKRVTAELGLKVVVVGRDLSKDQDLQPFVQNGSVTSVPAANPMEFIKIIKQSRAMFIPNIHDASPRVATDALACDVPLLMNTHIVGGWKYVVEETGEFFSSEDDVVDAVKKLLSPERQAKLSPRAYFKSHWGFERTALRLHAFIELIAGEERMRKARSWVTANGVFR